MKILVSLMLLTGAFASEQARAAAEAYVNTAPENSRLSGSIMPQEGTRGGGDCPLNNCQSGHLGYSSGISRIPGGLLYKVSRSEKIYITVVPTAEKTKTNPSADPSKCTDVYLHWFDSAKLPYYEVHPDEDQPTIKFNERTPVVFEGDSSNITFLLEPQPKKVLVREPKTFGAQLKLDRQPWLGIDTKERDNGCGYLVGLSNEDGSFTDWDFMLFQTTVPRPIHFYRFFISD